MGGVVLNTDTNNFQKPKYGLPTTLLNSQLKMRDIFLAGYTNATVISGL